MNFLDLIGRRRSELGDAIGRGLYHDFSAANAARFRATRRLIIEHARGTVLDIGCGHMPFRQITLRHADRYEGFDIEARVPEVDHLGDAQDMVSIPSAAYDTALCLEVLEHVPKPDRVVSEIYRVLRPGGRVILTVPHLSRLHELPHDYFRFTGHGLRSMLESASLEVLELSHYAGLFSFLAHQVSTVLLGLVWPVPGLRQVGYQLNRLLLVNPVVWADVAMDRRGLFALGYAAVARKPLASEGALSSREI